MFSENETLQKECGQELPLHTFAVCAYKDSPYLEECIRSLKEQEKGTEGSGQEVTSEIICCTSTPSPYIERITKKYQVPLYVRDGASNIREDWLFAYRKARGRLVTIAHQDDVYRKNYARELLSAYRRYPDLLVFVSDYLTLKMQKDGTAKVEPMDTVRLVKKLLRLPLRLHFLADRTWVKKSAVLFGNSLCCPACTYYKAVIGEDMFQSEFDHPADKE